MPNMAMPAPGQHAPILPPGDLDLKYLFCAKFKNGDIYEQTSEDKSPFTPGRPASYELLECEDDGTPKLDPVSGRVMYRSDIELFQMESRDYRFLVDLTDGHFEIQHYDKKLKDFVGASFFLDFPVKDELLRVVNFKRRRHHTNVTATVLEDHTVGLSDAYSVSQECEYHIGWTQPSRTSPCTIILV